ncbi:hypothetical protein BKA69DRAFT_1059773 [Paraphysoderma sedebokerense]|nr:hypothetical protein BKA69DRAFT_1059773 [Paraphysoderma sedebokerense]
MFSRVSSFSDHVKLMVSDIKHSFSKMNNVYSTLTEISEWVQKCTESERDMIQDLKTKKMHLMPIVEAEELLRDLSNSQKKLEKEFTDYQIKLSQVNSLIEAVDKLLASSVTQPVHDMHKSVRTEFNELNDILKSRVNLKDLLRRIYNHNRAYQQIQDWLTVARSTILGVQITDRGLDDIETKLSTFTQTFQTFQNSSKELQCSPDISNDVKEYLKSKSDVISNDWGNLQNLITAVKQKIGTAVATIEIGKTVDELEKSMSVYRERVLSVRLVDSNDLQSSQESSISVLTGLEPTIATLYSRIEDAEKSVSQLDSDHSHLKNRLSHLKTLHSELIDLIRFRKQHIEETKKIMTAVQFSEEITKLVESFIVILDGIYIDDVPLVEIDSTIQVVESRYQQFSSTSSRLSELIEQTVQGIHNDPQVDAIREKIKHESAEVTELIQKKKQGLLERKRDILEFMEIQRKGASSMSMTSPSVSPSSTSIPHRSVSPALSVTNSIAVSSSVSATAAQRSMPSSLPRPKSRNRSKSQSSQTRQPNLTYPTSNYPPRRSVTPTPIPTQSISRSSTPLSAPAATNSDKIPRQRSKSVSSASPSFQNFSSNLMSPPQSPTPPLPSLPSFSYPTFSSTTSQSYHHHLHQSNQLPTPISLLSSPPLSIPTPDPSFDFTSTEYTFPSTTSPPPPPSSSDPTTFQLQFYNPDPSDPIDLHLSNLISSLGGVYFSIRKLSKGKYQFGKLDGKIVNLKMIREGVCLVRVGGGWKRLEEWVLEGRDFVGVGVKERSVLGLE